MENFIFLQNKSEHQNSWNLLESNPTTMLYGWYHVILSNSWWYKIDIKDRQQVLPSIPFASPLAKPN